MTKALRGAQNCCISNVFFKYIFCLYIQIAMKLFLTVHLAIIHQTALLHEAPVKFENDMFIGCKILVLTNASTWSLFYLHV